jgi:AhpD family alkylhydroperoxidase
MTARMKNPATFLPDVTQALVTLGQSLPENGGVDLAILELVHQRVSQINGCAWCLDYGARNSEGSEITKDQTIQLPAWRDAVVFSDAQRAALDLAEHMTRFADRMDPVPDAVWNAAAEQFDEKQLATLVVWVATTNLYNRINVTTRQVPGTW